jgi:hypothetical protein
MTTTAQDALNAFKEARKTLALTSIDLAYLIQKENLEVAAEQEIEANRVETETAQIAQATQGRTDLINMLQQLGFVCDNSQADWNKLYNFPEVYGSNWQTQATYQKSISPDVNYFLSTVQNSIVFRSYEIGRPYKLNETFLYAGNLYKVVQAHTSQANWVPSATPALYTKIVPAGVVTDFVQPTGAQDAYKKGDRVRFNGSIYESLIDANVWSPTAYPAGWKIV